MVRRRHPYCLLLALGLSFLLTMVYMTFVVKPAVYGGAADGGEPAVAALGAPDGGAPSSLAPVSAVAAPATDGGMAPVAARPSPPLKQIAGNREAIRYLFSSEGAALTRAELTSEKTREQPKVSVAEGFARVVGKKPPPPIGAMMPTGPGWQGLPIALDRLRIWRANPDTNVRA